MKRPAEFLHNNTTPMITQMEKEMEWWEYISCFSVF